MSERIPHISVVVPVYGAPESLIELCRRLRVSLEGIDEEFEVLLVNDASPDESWILIDEQARADKRYVGIHLSRNFGQHPAIAAGLRSSRGEWVVVMDCDLQDRPEEIPRLYEQAQQGFDQVVAARSDRKDSWLKRITSAGYLRTLSYLTDQRINPAVGNFGIYHRRVIDAINSLPEQGRTFGLLALWVGYRRYELEVQHDARPSGRSSYSIKQLVRQGISGIISHSDKPLRITMKIGVAIAGVAFLAGVVVILRTLMGQTASGWASLMVVVVFLCGVILMSMGMLGLYVGRVLEESKRRPTFLVWKQTDGRLGGVVTNQDADTQGLRKEESDVES